MDAEPPVAAFKNLGAYVAQLARRIPMAVEIPCRPAQIGAWKAQEHQCHSNAAYWCAHNPEDKLVPGWLYFSFLGLNDFVRFTAHTVIRLRSGELRDITPTQASMPFIEALESPPEYDELVEKRGIMHLDVYRAEGRVAAFGRSPRRAG